MEAVSEMSFESSVTIKQIARESGVSAMTVSRALNHPEKVKTATRVRVMEAAKRLKYKPNSVAQALSNGRTNIIYCYIPKDLVGSNFYLDVLAGISEELGERGYSVLLRKNWYAGEACDGIILMGLGTEDAKKAVDLSSKRQVVVFGHVDGVDSMDVDNRLGMKMMAEYLLQKGHKKILYLSISNDRDFVSDRESGFLEAINGKAEFTIWKMENNPKSAHAYLKKHFVKDDGYDAICAASDELALGAISYLKEQGIKVPDDISVTGFDGLGRELLSVPAITSIHQPIFEIGKRLASRLVSKIKENCHRCEKSFVAPTLLVNGTVR